MKGPFLHVSLGVAALLVGILTGRQFASPGSREPEPDKANFVREGDPGSRYSTGPGVEKIEAHDLTSLIGWRLRQEAGNPDVLRELERLDVPALRNLLVGIAAADPRVQQDMQGVLEMAAKELYRREGEPALQWAAGLAPKESSRAILSQLMCAAAYDTPELAKPWIARFRDEHGKEWEGTFLYWAVRGASSRGAEDLVGLGELFGDRIWRSGASLGPYPEDFNFHRLLTGVGDKVWLADTANYWGAKDKEAAWTGVKAMLDASGKGAGYLGCLFFGVAAVEGEGPAAAWAAGKLADLPESMRKDAITSLRSFGRVSGGGVEIVMNALPSEADRVTFAASVVSPQTSNGDDVVALRHLGSDSSRVDVLVNAASKYRGGMNNGPPGHAEKMRAYFEATMARLNLPQESRDQVNAALLPPAGE